MNKGNVHKNQKFLYGFMLILFLCTREHVNKHSMISGTVSSFMRTKLTWKRSTSRMRAKEFIRPPIRLEHGETVEKDALQTQRE